MTRQPFSEHEFDVVRMHKCGAVGMMANMGIEVPELEPIYNRPVSEKENWKLFFEEKNPYWKPVNGCIGSDVNIFRPRINPDNAALLIVYDGEEPVVTYDGEHALLHSDWFDTDWLFVPATGGSMTAPGSPKFVDMNDWRDVVSIPNLDDLPWEGFGERNREYLDTTQYNQLGVSCLLFERMMALMDVENAVVALIDEDQREAMHDFLNEVADFVIDYINRVCDSCNIDGVVVCDDWGHQENSFFSLDTAMEVFVPYLKRIVDAVHARGMFCELHSCGKNEGLVPAFEAAGIDLWCPQDINDIDKMLEMYPDAHISYGDTLIDVAPDATEEEQVEAAEAWFDKYKDKRVVCAFLNGTPTIERTIYRLSREYYTED